MCARDRAETRKQSRPDLDGITPAPLQTHLDAQHPSRHAPPSLFVTTRLLVNSSRVVFSTELFFCHAAPSASSAATDASARRSKLNSPPHTERASSSTRYREAVFQMSINSSPAERDAYSSASRSERTSFAPSSASA